MFIFLSVILGLAVGSFLNVCIYRIPQKKSIIKPRSHCPNCKTPIAWYDNIPILSFLILKGKCRNCKQKISAGYPVIEAVSGFLTAIFAYKFGFTLWFGVSIVAVYTLIVLSIIDIKTFTIPDELSVGFLVLGLITSFLNPNFTGAIFAKIAQSLLGAFCGFAVIYIIALIGEFLFKKEAMGGGDIKLLSGVGAFVGWYGVITTLIIGSFFGALYGIYLIVVKKAKRQDPIPFGPFLALGAVINLYQVFPFWDIFM